MTDDGSQATACCITGGAVVNIPVPPGPHLVHGIRLGAALEQQADGIRVASQRCKVQGRLLVLQASASATQGRTTQPFWPGGCSWATLLKAGWQLGRPSHAPCSAHARLLLPAGPGRPTASRSSHHRCAQHNAPPCRRSAHVGCVSLSEQECQQRQPGAWLSRHGNAADGASTVTQCSAGNARRPRPRPADPKCAHSTISSSRSRSWGTPREQCSQPSATASFQTVSARWAHAATPFASAFEVP